MVKAMDSGLAEVHRADDLARLIKANIFDSLAEQVADLLNGERFLFPAGQKIGVLIMGQDRFST